MKLFGHGDYVLVAIVVPVQFDETNESESMELHASPLFLVMVQMESEKKYGSAWRTSSVPVLIYPNCYPTVCRPHKLHARVCAALITPVTPPLFESCCALPNHWESCSMSRTLRVMAEWNCTRLGLEVYCRRESEWGSTAFSLPEATTTDKNTRFCLAAIGYCRLRWGRFCAYMLR